MKKNIIHKLLAAAALVAAIQFTACKGKQDEGTTDTNVIATDSSTATIPATIAPDDELSKGVKDATKDFPGVKAEVANGEITLTGDITRERLQKLMMSLNSLHPKKINNNLTITE